MTDLTDATRAELEAELARRGSKKECISCDTRESLRNVNLIRGLGYRTDALCDQCKAEYESGR